MGERSATHRFFERPADLVVAHRSLVAGNVGFGESAKARRRSEMGALLSPLSDGQCLLLSSPLGPGPAHYMSAKIFIILF